MFIFKTSVKAKQKENVSNNWSIIDERLMPLIIYSNTSQFLKWTALKENGKKLSKDNQKNYKWLITYNEMRNLISDQKFNQGNVH